MSIGNMPYQPKSLRFWDNVGLEAKGCPVSRCIRQVVSGYRVSVSRHLTRSLPTMTFHIGIFPTIGEAEGCRDRFAEWWDKNKGQFDEETKGVEVVNAFRETEGLPKRARGTPTRKA